MGTCNSYLLGARTIACPGPLGALFCFIYACFLRFKVSTELKGGLCLLCYSAYSKVIIAVYTCLTCRGQKKKSCVEFIFPPICGSPGFQSLYWLSYLTCLLSVPPSRTHCPQSIPLICLLPAPEVAFRNHRPPLPTYKSPKVSKSQAISWTFKVLPELALKPRPTTMGTAPVLRTIL